MAEIDKSFIDGALPLLASISYRHVASSAESISIEIAAPRRAVYHSAGWEIAINKFWRRETFTSALTIRRGQKPRAAHRRPA